MDKNSRIYLAGHNGLVGSAIFRNLKSSGYKNVICKASGELDLRNQKATEEFFKKESPAYVFLAAAKVGGILANSTYKADFIYDNIMIAANVINSSYKYGVKKLLNLGSSCIYPKHCPQPMKEEYLLSGELEPTNEPYAIAKISAIKLCRYYNEQYRTNFISVMPTNLYGVNDNFGLETSHVLAAFIRKFHLAKLLSEDKHDDILSDLKYYGDFSQKESSVEPLLAKRGIFKDSLNLWGSGEPYREFLYVDDLARACLFLMEKFDYEDIGEFVNIGTGKEVKIKELAELVKRIVGFRGNVVWDKTKPDGTPRKLLDISRIKEMGWEPQEEIESGIHKVYGWYKSRNIQDSRS